MKLISKYFSGIIDSVRYKKTRLLFLLCSVLLLSNQVQADIVYGSVQGLVPGNLTLLVYQNNKMVVATAIHPAGGNRHEYQLNLPPGEYQIKYNDINQTIINYPGTNRANISFRP